MRADDRDVLAAVVTWHLRGPWLAELELEGEDEPSGVIEITADSGLRLVGTVTEARASAGRTAVRVVGGAGGLGTPVGTRQYRGAPLVLVLRDLMRDSGERLDDDPLVSHTFQTWVRPAHSPARVLDDLCAALGLSWRVLDSGAVWVGSETWPAGDRGITPLEHDVGAGILVLSDDEVKARPGTTIDGRRIVTVQHVQDGARTRSRAWTGETSSRALGDVLARVVGARTGSPLWGALHPAEVLAQAADGSLEVVPDDTRVPPMVGVPLRTGIPGLEVEVLPGARVLVAFEGQDPRRPIALPSFDRDASKLKSLHVTADTEITVNAPTVRIADQGGEILAGDTPASPVARVGDIVQVALAFMVPDPTKGIMISSPVGPCTGTLGTAPLPAIAVGQIVSGKNSFRA